MNEFYRAGKVEVEGGRKQHGTSEFAITIEETESDTSIT
jgi:hypothetical protein